MTSHVVARLRRLLVVATVGALVVVAASPVVGGSGLGAIFNLGKTNIVNTTTTLKGSTSTRALQVTNTGTGAALQLTTRAGVPPMKVNSSAVVTNLNADQLDGHHGSDFMPAGAHPDAATLSGIPASGFVQPSGLTLVQAGVSSWRPISSGINLGFNWNPSNMVVSRSAPGYDYVISTPDLPAAQFGQAMQLDAVELCYQTTAGTQITGVEIDMPSSTTGDVNTNSVFTDWTVRTDSACRIYTLTTPAALSYANTATLVLSLQWVSAPSTFTVTRTTFILEATGAAATAPAAPGIVTRATPGMTRPRGIQSVPSK